MSRILTVAPTPVDFVVTAGAAVRDPSGYAHFWKQVAAQSPVTGIEFDHVVDVTESPRYGTLRSDALQRPLHVLSGKVARTDLAVEVPEELAALWRCVAEVNFWLHDHSIVVVGLEGEVGGWLGDGAEGPEARLDDLREGINTLTKLAVHELVSSRLQPVLELARRLDPDSDFIDWEDDEWTSASPRWVSRSLVLDLDEPGTDVLARRWLADAGEAEVVDDLVAGRTTHVSRWLNYVHRGRRAETTTEIQREGKEAWRAMRYAQYFYAALDLVDDRLTGVLAQTTRGRKPWELSELTERLRRLSHRAELVMLDLQSLRKYVTRPVLYELDQILDAWGHTHLVEEPVRFKISICDRRLEELAAGRQARAGTVTDVILLGIGVTSVLGTALAVTDFGRSVATDPGQAGYGSTSSGLTEWFASQPADAILVGSLVVSALLVVLFLVVRRSGSS